MRLRISYPHSTTVFEIYTDSKYVYRILNMFYESIDTELTYKYRLTYDYIQSVITVDSNQHITVNSQEEALYWIIRFIRHNLKFEEHWMAYHGAVAQINNRTYMFLGHTGAGKTTLMTYLSCQKDVAVISEDITIVNCMSGEVMPLNHPFAVRKESFELLTQVYNCDIVPLALNYNDRCLVKNNSTRPNQKYFVQKCFLLDRKVTDKVSCSDIAKYEDYITNAYCYSDLLRNARCAILLSDVVKLQKLHYHNLKDAYEFLSEYHETNCQK